MCERKKKKKKMSKKKKKKERRVGGGGDAVAGWVQLNWGEESSRRYTLHLGGIFSFGPARILIGDNLSGR